MKIKMIKFFEIYLPLDIISSVLCQPICGGWDYENKYMIIESRHCKEIESPHAYDDDVEFIVEYFRDKVYDFMTKESTAYSIMKLILRATLSEKYADHGMKMVTALNEGFYKEIYMGEIFTYMIEEKFSLGLNIFMDWWRELKKVADDFDSGKNKDGLDLESMVVRPQQIFNMILKESFKELNNIKNGKDPKAKEPLPEEEKEYKEMVENIKKLQGEIKKLREEGEL